MPLDISHHPTQLTGLTPREQITDVLLLACLAIDHNNRALFISCFSTTTPPSMVFDNSPCPGAESCADKVLGAVGQLDTQHLVSNIRIDIREGGQTAWLGCNALNQHMRAGEGLKEGEKQKSLSGQFYEIKFVKEEGGWKIEQWVFKVIWREGTNAVFS
jgi:hypothetical protein